MVATSGWQALHRWFWLDECYTAYAMAMPDFSSLLRWNVVSEMNPPAFYVASWIVTRATGTSDMGIRCLPLFLTAMAFVLTWLQTERVFGRWAAAISVPLAFAAYFRPETFFEARPTINLIFTVALAGWLHGRVAAALAHPAWLGVSHAYLCLTHTTGCLYSGSVFVALASAQGLSRDGRWRELAWTAVGWVGFLAWLPALVIQHQNTQPHYWIPPPDFSAFFATVTRIVWWPFLPLGFVAAVPLTVWLCRIQRTEPTLDNRSRVTLAAFASGVVVGTPIAAFIVSLTGTSIFLDRYLSGGLVGWAIVLAGLWWAGERWAGKRFFQLVSHFVPNRQKNLLAGLRGCLALLAVAAMAIPAFSSKAQPRPGSWITKVVPENLPLVFESPHLLLPALRYTRLNNLFFVLDREAALDPRSHRAAIDHYYSFELLRRFFPDFKLLGVDELRKLPEFGIVDDPYETWAEIRFGDTKDYLFRGLSKQPFQVVHLKRRSAAQRDQRDHTE